MKRIIFSSVLLLLSLIALQAKDKLTSVAVVTDKTTYENIKDDIEAYVSSITNSGKKGILIIDQWNHPDSIRTVLENLYKNENLEGAILIGDIPVPMIRDAQHLTTAFKMNQKRDWKDSSIPSDRFYDDFDLKFDYLKQDENVKLLHYYSLKANSSQKIKCDIYSSRIKSPLIPGVSKYEAISQYLKKAVAQKQKSKAMSQILYFAGHGYNSESMSARIDEAWALREQFPFLGVERGADLNFINYDYDKFVKERLMSAIKDPKLDLAILHHHGSTDVQYLSATPASSMTSDWIEYSKKFFRGKIRDADDTTSAKKNYMKNYDVPESWVSNSFDPKVVEADSIFSASMDINIPDMYGYVPNAKIVILDACFNGAFCEDDYIAGYYIFNPGETMVVKANSVNTLQDTWTNELMGLLNAGVCVGNWAKGQLTLESHLFGDATFCFENRYPQFNIDRSIVLEKDNNKYWNKLIKSNIVDIKALAIKKLSENGAISSEDLIEIQKNSPSAVIRLEAFMSLKKRADNCLVEAILLGMEDSYELTQRLSTLTAAKSGDPKLKPEIEKYVADPTTSQRVFFHMKEMKNIFSPSESTLNEFKSLNSSSESDKNKGFTISALRNSCDPNCVDDLLQFIKESDNQTLRTQAAEAFGWYLYSYKKNYIIQKCEELVSIEKNEVVKNELIKTINRLNNK
ncbi:MAG: hypothetical protein M0R23_00060 [Bacteroidales bacterium]|nr:hypothetical protein [Bacteroidales bacterium]